MTPRHATNLVVVLTAALVLLVLGCTRNDALVLDFHGTNSEPGADSESDSVDITDDGGVSISIDSVAEESATIDFRYNYAVEYTAGDDAVITVENLPGWLTFDADTLTGVPSYLDRGTTDTITITLSAGDDIVTQTFAIKVDFDPALIAYWPFDETTGAEDVTDHNHDGILFGYPTWLPDGGHNGGGAIRFNGDDGNEDYVEIPPTQALTEVDEGDYTLSAWVRPNSVPTGTENIDSDYAYGILLTGVQYNGIWYDCNQHFASAHHVDASGVPEAIDNLSDSTYDPGEYYHVASVINQTQQETRLYVNGVEESSINDRDTSINPRVTDQSWFIGIGEPGAADWAWRANADIDDVRIHARVLTEAEIRTLAGVD